MLHFITILNLISIYLSEFHMKMYTYTYTNPRIFHIILYGYNSKPELLLIIQS